MELTFLGATRTVTGSKYLVSNGRQPVLVDCGLFQGLKELRLENRRPFPVAPASIGAVILTHAHLDHTGYLPQLTAGGFEGAAWCTPATADLCGIILPDSGHLQEEEAARANEKGYSKHAPALPLYTQADAEHALAHLRPEPMDQPFTAGDLAVRFRRAGHILGSATVTIEHAGATVVFSGDLGRPADPILLPAEPPESADYVVIESTYGDRLHGPEDSQALLGEVINRTARRGGVVVIPSFAVGRTQTLLFHIHALIHNHVVPELPVFVDSPMAIDATQMLLRHREEHHLDEDEVMGMRDTARMTNSREDSKEIDRRPGPMIVISASGMATGGRVLFHLARFAPDPRNTILLAGFQAVGTRGADMAAGADHLRIHGADVPVRAEIVSLHGLSAHADANELMAWMGGFKRAPRQVFVTHGEPAAAEALRGRIERELGWRASVPSYGDKARLDGSRPLQPVTASAPT